MELKNASKKSCKFMDIMLMYREGIIICWIYEWARVDGDDCMFSDVGC